MKADRLRFLLRCIPNLNNLQFSADNDNYKPTDFEELFQQECPKIIKLKLQVYFNPFQPDGTKRAHLIIVLSKTLSY